MLNIHVHAVNSRQSALEKLIPLNLVAKGTLLLNLFVLYLINYSDA